MSIYTTETITTIIVFSYIYMSLYTRVYLQLQELLLSKYSIVLFFNFNSISISNIVVAIIFINSLKATF